MSKLTPIIPDFVTLCGLKVKTEYVSHLAADFERWGEFTPRTLTISLDKDMSQERSFLTYCHELVESIVDIYALKDFEESDKQAIGIALYELLMQGKLCKVEEV